MPATFRAASPNDWPAIREIYAEGVASGLATFEHEIPSWERWDTAHLSDCRLVAESEGSVVGWAALSPVSSRAAYSGVAEVSLYVASTARRQGIGRALLQSLIEDSLRAGFWTLQAGIFPENEVSVALHESCGFRVVGRRERLGHRQGIWKDVVLMERRSRGVEWK